MRRFLSSIILTTIISISSAAAIPVPDDGVAAARWADSVYSTLSERQRVAQLVFPNLMPQQGDATRAAIKRLIKSEGCGGLLLSEGSLEQYASLINYAKDIATVPLMVTFDGEWGLSMRVKDMPRFPHNMGLGAINDYRLLYDYGAEVAHQCRALGVDVNFAPVVDVNSNPANPVIGYRSFGEDPERVARAATAYSLGLEDHGVMAVAKHFPGHGDTDVDSHKALPTVNHSRAMLDSVDFVPFRDFIGAGCSGVMMGHISIPALDASGQPASLSPEVGAVLRRQLGFDGIIFTDALGMKGAVDNKGRNTAVAALLAGADVLLSPPSPKEAIDVIMAAIANGTVSKEIIKDRCLRLLRYKYRFCRNARITDAGALRKDICSPQAQVIIDRLASASLTLLKNNSLLPLGSGTATLSLVNIGSKADNDFTETCRHYAPIEPYTSADFNISKINDTKALIVGVYNDSQSSRQALESIVAKVKVPVVAVFFVNPYKMQKFAAMEKCSAVLLAYDDIPSLRIAAAQALFGGVAVSGRLPVNLRDFKAGQGIMLHKTRLGYSTPAAEGMAPWLADSIEAVVRKGLATKAFPGCQVLVARNGNIVYEGAFGRLSSAKDSRAVDRRTAYDLASVSKAIGTLPGIMKVYDSGKLSLDNTLGELISEITDTLKTDVTVRNLLYHETGMPASLDMFNTMIDTLSYTGKLLTPRYDKAHSIKIQNKLYGNATARLRSDIVGKTKSEKFPVEIAKGIYGGSITYDTIMRRIYNIPTRPTRAYNYSCLNFCLLMDIEQRLTGRAHDEFVDTEIFAPLGAYRMGYRPHTSIGASNVAATEHDTFLRRQTLNGFVHDELAAFSGGVQGNAGLFGNAADVAKVCQMLLNGGTYGGNRILKESTAKLFTTDKSPTCRRGLGFDKPDVENPDYSPTCDRAAAEVFGHLGFTGTVFWVDPVQNVIFVFLTNRVNPTRDNAAFNKLNIRPRLFDLVYRSLD